jgi:inner membrane protein
MHRRGHYGAALLAYAPLAAVTLALGFGTVTLLGGVAAVGIAMLPDWDQRLPGVPHRGPTHTVRFAIGVGAVGGVIGAGAVGADPTSGLLSIPAGAAFGFAVGAGTTLSHIGADALTPAGVEPFGDGRRYSYDLCRADSLIGNHVLLAVGLLGVGAGIALGIVLNSALPV